MKKLVLIALLAACTLGAGVLGRDKDKNIVQDFMPTAFGVLSSHKPAKTLDVTTVHAVRLNPSAATTIKVNGTGTAWPIAANVVQEYRIPSGVTAITFVPISSVFTSKTKLYYQTQ